MSQSLEAYLVLSALLFGIGAFGFLARRNAIAMLMSIELMLNAVNLTLVTFNRMHGADHSGQIMAFFIIAIAAAEIITRLDSLNHADERELAFLGCHGSARAAPDDERDGARE